MSDLEDHPYPGSTSAKLEVEAEEKNYDEEQVPASTKGLRTRYDEDDEDEEDDDDDEDEDDDEEGDGLGRKGKKRSKHRHKNKFLDIEAEVSDEDEEDEEDEDYGGEGFIEAGDEIDEDRSRRRYAQLDRQRDGQEKSLEEIANDISQRYSRKAVRYSGDLNEVPQRLLMPSVHDASLWQVRVRPGKERDIIFSLMRKAIDREDTVKPLSIFSAFQRDSLSGMIYVEARSQAQVLQACDGLVGVFPSRGIQLVPIEEMASLLQIKKQDLTITAGSWVRIKRGKYAGDLAQVVDVTENGEDVGLKFVPRIDLNPKDDMDSVKKRKKLTASSGLRPPQRLFNYEEIVKVWGRKHISKRNQVYVFQNDTYKDGFIEKDFKLSALILEDVNPTLDEIEQFSKRQDGGGELDNQVDLSVIAEASRKAAVAVLQPGDHVEVFEGEQAGVHGVVEEIHQDVVIITALGVELDGQKVELQARSVRKRFKPGDHVKVMTGQNADETGLVVSVADNVVTFLSDMSMQEVSVFSKDLREAAEVGSGTNIIGNYELHDLVQLDAQTVGVIYKTERDSFRVLDQNGQVRLVQPHQISMRRDSMRAIATDSKGRELRVNDMVKEVDGEGRKGQVLHIHQSFFAFLHNREFVDNGGVFVTRARSLAPLAPTGAIPKPGADLSKMNPSAGAPVPGIVGVMGAGRTPRDRDIGLTVTIVQGQQKGYVGTIKDVTDSRARVELRTGNKIVMIDKSKLRERLSSGKLVPLTGRGSQAGRGGFNNFGTSRNANPYASSPNASSFPGGRTPAWGAVGRTPNPYATDGRTPAWNASSRTPNPYADGGKTPAWNVGSRTPNPYAEGGRTPAWTASSRTPNPYAGGGGWGGSFSPAQNNSSSSWGGPPAPPSNDELGPWGVVHSAPTPSAESPNYQTPGPQSHGGYYSAKTPGLTDISSAPTPATSGEADEPPDDSDPDLEWIFDPAVAQYQQRVRIAISNTRSYNYLEGDLEGKQGRIVAAAQAGSSFNQTVMVQFDSGETRSMQVQHIVPVAPSAVGDEALVIKTDKDAMVVMGEVVKVREMLEDGRWTVTNADTAFRNVRGSILVGLYAS